MCISFRVWKNCKYWHHEPGSEIKRLPKLTLRTQKSLIARSYSLITAWFLSFPNNFFVKNLLLLDAPLSENFTPWGVYQRKYGMLVPQFTGSLTKMDLMTLGSPCVLYHFQILIWMNICFIITDWLNYRYNICHIKCAYECNMFLALLMAMNFIMSITWTF